MAAGSLREVLRTSAPSLSSQVDALCAGWLEGLSERLQAGDGQFRPKQLNDPVWGTVELQPREVALLDSRLLQRMRGVRQLGLAQLVFPGASHDRLEHIVGVVGAVERMADALERQVTRWNAEQKRLGQTTHAIPSIDDEDRSTLRLAALFQYPSGEGRGCVRLSSDCDVLVGFVPVPGQQFVQAGCGVVVDPA